MAPSNQPPLPQPSRYTCPNCGAGWNEPRAYCPHCGMAQANMAQKSGLPSWVKVMFYIFGALGLLCFCALGACFLFLTNSKF